MKDNLSNYTRASLYMGDLTDNMPIRRGDCYTITELDYMFYRLRGNDGLPCGLTHDPYITFSIKSQPDNKLKEMYERLRSNETFSFSFIFNSVYDSSNLLVEYSNCMVASGYVVSIEEEYDSSQIFGEDNERISMSVKIIMHSTTYVGSQSSKTVTFV